MAMCLLSKLRTLVRVLGSVCIAIRLRRVHGECLTLYGFYGDADESPQRNIGDNAILTAMLHQLSDVPLPKLIGVISRNGEYLAYGEEYEIPRSGVNPERWHSIIAKTKVLVIGGGGMFYDYRGSGGTTAGLLVLSLLFRLAGRKIMWYSIGVGPLNSRRARVFTGIAARLACTVTVRDVETAMLLHSLPVKPAQVHQTSDPVYGLPVSNRLPKRKLRGVPPVIGISLIPFYRIVHHEPKRDSSIVQEYAVFVERLLRMGYAVKCFTFTNQQDREIIDELLANACDDRIELCGYGASLEGFLDEYAQCDYIIGMRFHSLILGHLLGIPTGAVIYHPKTRSLIRQLDAGACACELSELSEARLRQILSQLQTERAGLQRAYSAHIEGQQKAFAKNMEFVRRICM